MDLARRTRRTLAESRAYHRRLERAHARAVARATIEIVATAFALSLALATAASGASGARLTSAPHFVESLGACGVGPGQFALAYGMAVAPDGDLFVGDYGSNRIVRFDATGAFVTSWYVPASPWGVAVAADGTVWVVLAELAKVLHFDASGNALPGFGSFGHGRGQFIQATGLTISPTTGKIYVCDNDNGRVQRFAADGTYEYGWGGAAAGMPHATNVAVDGVGNIVVLDAGDNQLMRWDTDGRLLGQWNTGGADNAVMALDYGLAAGPSGDLLVIDGHSTVHLFTPAGQWLTSWGVSGTGDGAFGYAWSVAAGAAGLVYVSDRELCRVDKFQFSPSDPAIGTSWGAVKATYR